jgi:hypothetical protein
MQKSAFLRDQAKAKEGALAKAHHAEAAFEALKGGFRELRRREEAAIAVVEAAEAAWAEAARAVADERAVMQRRRAMAADRLQGAELDRRLLFAEVQAVEGQLRAERQRKAEAQAVAARYRDMLSEVMA